MLTIEQPNRRFCPDISWVQREDLKPAEIRGQKIIAPDPNIWYIVDGLKFDDTMIMQGSNIVANDCTFKAGVRWPANGQQIVFLDCGVTNQDASGMGPDHVVTDGSAVCRRVLIHGGYVERCGDVNAQFDQDYHGIAPGHTSELIINNAYIGNCSGNGIQVSHQPRNHANSGIFVHDCIIASCKQSPIAIKYADRVVIANNQLCDSEPRGEKPSDPGAGIVMQYDHRNVWVVDNQIFDCQFGIVIGDSFGDGPITIWNNRIHDITPSDHPLWTTEEKFDPRHPMRPGTAIVHRRGKVVRTIANQCWNAYRFYAMDDAERDEPRRVDMYNNWHDGDKEILPSEYLSDIQWRMRGNYMTADGDSFGWTFMPFVVKHDGNRIGVRDRFLNRADLVDVSYLDRELQAVVDGGEA